MALRYAVIRSPKAHMSVGSMTLEQEHVPPVQRLIALRCSKAYYHGRSSLVPTCSAPTYSISGQRDGSKVRIRCGCFRNHPLHSVGGLHIVSASKFAQCYGSEKEDENEEGESCSPVTVSHGRNIADVEMAKFLVQVSLQYGPG